MNESWIIQNLKKGKIGIFPTDTAFGVGCRMDNEESVKRLFEIRKRPTKKPLLVLVSSIEMAERYVDINNDVKKTLIKKYWPGGLTLILRCRREIVPGIVRANSKSLAVRMPDHKMIRKVIEKVGVPIVAPSANFAGDKTPLSFSEVSYELKDKVDFVLSGVCTIKGVSTIIDCTKKPWEIVRQGVVKIENRD